MCYIIKSTILTSFSIRQEDMPRDCFEGVADVCLFFPRTVWGHVDTVHGDEIRTNVITQIAMEILCFVGILFTLPLTILGLCAACCSKTYNLLLASHHLASPSLLQAQDQVIKEIFEHVLQSTPDADGFTRLIFDHLKGRFTHKIGENLMEVLLSHPTYVATLAQFATEETELSSDGKPSSLGTHQLILHCRSLEQFKTFIQACQNDEGKIRSCIEMLLNFFHDDRNSQDTRDFFRDRFHFLAQFLTEESLAKHIFEGKGLQKELLEKQIPALCEIFPIGIIHDQSTSFSFTS